MQALGMSEWLTADVGLEARVDRLRGMSILWSPARWGIRLAGDRLNFAL